MGAPGTAPVGEPVLSPEPAVRRRPPWRRRGPLIAGLAAVTLAVAAVIVLVARPSAQEIRYAGLPTPCDALTPARVARYLPGATGKAQGGSASGVSRVGACTWDSETGGQSRLLSATVVVFESSARVSDAQAEYKTLISQESEIMGKGDTVSTRRVPDLGNQAVSMVVTGHDQSPGEILLPQVGVIVQAGNADIWLNYSAGAVGTPSQETPPPPVAEQVATTIALARDVLATLAH